MEEKPKLRPIEAIPMAVQGEQIVYLRDPSGMSDKTLALAPRAFFLAALCDGNHTLRDIQAEYMRRFGDLLFIEKIEEIVRQLDEALMLEGEQFEAAHRAVTDEFARAQARPAAHAGTAYPAEPGPLREMLDGFFDAPGGPGRPASGASGARLVAVAAPHIDPKRGGPTYAHAYKALAERCDADTFVVLGIVHHGSSGPFVVTDKDFETPLGTVPCDRDFARELMQRSGLAKENPDEILHRTEHSIEFQALFLRHIFGASRPVRIVGVLCGPLQTSAGGEADPGRTAAISDFIRALKSLLEERGGKAAVIAAVDLSHVGRRFGDACDLTSSLLARVEAEDRALLEYAENMDAAGFLGRNRQENDRRHVCGVPALYVMLSAAPARRGRLLHYAQAPDTNAQMVVSFAAMAFEQ